MTTEHVLPVVSELRPAPDPEQTFIRLSRRSHCLFLDSALRDPQLGRYSFLTADPFDYLEVPADGSDAITRLQSKLAGLSASPLEGLPPFQGGAGGLLAYELGHSLETIAPPQYDEFGVPALAMGLYDVVLAWDHGQDRAWIISQGFPEIEPRRRLQHARQRLGEFQAWIARVPHRAEASVCEPMAEPRLDPSQLAPQYPTDSLAGVTSDFGSEGYRRALRRVIDYIHAGDVFQVNLSQRLLFPARDHTLPLYLRLRQRNPATFAGYFDLGSTQIASASPERFLCVRGRQVETRPIKGTRQRTRRPEADLFSAADLRRSDKDRAENVMIVDLLRNDISKVCDPQSVYVAELCQLENYQYVQHLVSAVCGRLRDDSSPLELVRATFPGGSITGAPKVRAMQIISELEPTARGPYCGALGYLGFDGALDLSILIRTVTSARGWWQLPVGGGIVAQSDPQQEYGETWHKAKGLLRALV